MALKTSIKEFSALLGDKESLLDKHFRHLAQKIELHWSYDEFYPFIEKLLLDTRNGNRAGLPVEVMREISDLYEIHEKKFPVKKDAGRYAFHQH
ncbi:MAG: hypothetical protein LV471_07065 [Nitrosomonas sp.]|nr:hypothetical protein [Nitrosomonas sp.]